MKQIMQKVLLRSALILCVSVGTASAALAQQVSLTMNNGRVTLKTQNATVRQILDEWARVGGTTVVNAEKITGQPVTLSLIDVPEGQALETVLRSAAGYMVSERQTPAAARSRFERITVMARSTPVNSSSGSAAGNNANAYTPGPMPPGGGFEAPVNVVEDDGDPPAPMAPVVNPYAQGVNAAGANNNGVPGMGTGLGQQQAGQAGGVNPTQAQQQNGVGVNPVTPGYSNVYGQSGATGAAATTTAGSGAGDTVNVNPPETKFDYANPQKYFQQRGQNSGTQAMQPYPGVPLSSTGSGTGTATPSSTPANPGTGTAGTVTPTVPANTPSNQNPYSPNFNPYNLPAGSGVPGSTSATPQQSVEPDRAKYANPYVQPTNPPE
jgi:hypothetical protein